jgi:hypothetical protein
MLAMVRNDSRVHQAELKKKEEGKKEKKMSSFPILRNCSRPFARLFARLLSFPSRSRLPCCHVQKNTLMRLVTHSIMDMLMIMRVA